MLKGSCSLYFKMSICDVVCFNSDPDKRATYLGQGHKFYNVQ